MNKCNLTIEDIKNYIRGDCWAIRVVQSGRYFFRMNSYKNACYIYYKNMSLSNKHYKCDCEYFVMKHDWFKAKYREELCKDIKKLYREMRNLNDCVVIYMFKAKIFKIKIVKVAPNQYQHFYSKRCISLLG